MRRKLKSRSKPIQVPTEPVEPTYAESQAGLTRREKRIAEVVSMMSRGAWLSGVTDDLLAKRWDCSSACVRQIAAEANRVIRARLRDDPEAQKLALALLLQNIETIRAKAMGNGDAQSLRVGLDALRAYGFYLGLEPAKKLDVTSRHDPVEGWTVEEKLAYARDGKRPRRALGHLNGGANGADAGGEDESVH
jgi:hypothetical protein